MGFVHMDTAEAGMCDAHGNIRVYGWILDIWSTSQIGNTLWSIVGVRFVGKLDADEGLN